MRNYTQIKNAVLALNFTWLTKPFQINYVFERVDFVITNKFTDFWHLCYLNDANVECILTIPCTTKAGTKGAFLEPTTVDGIKGTAIIESPQQVINGWEFHDTDKEFSSYPYFRQISLVDYWRDGNCDLKADKINEQKKKLFGTHWHRMSQNNTYGSGLINNWSLGCMGSPEPEFEKILAIVRKHVSLYGTKMNGTIIESLNIK